MIEHEFPYESFIGGWYIPEKICDNLIEFFNINKHLAREGKYGRKNQISYDKNRKESLEITIDKNYHYYPFYEYRLELQKVLDKYTEKHTWSKQTDHFNIHENYNLQYYKPYQGFKTWHFERGGNIDRRRHLVFMTYLNDVDDGGTEFLYQKLISPAKKGLTLIWPVGFTHTHKGQISTTKEKYIITGWYSFDEPK